MRNCKYLYEKKPHYAVNLFRIIIFRFIDKPNTLNGNYLLIIYL